MFSKINLQYLISYLGSFPFFLVIFNKYLFLLIKNETSIQFIIYYTLIIVVFIGAINWNLNERINNLIVIYGFIPSLFAVIIIFLNLYGIESSALIFTLIFFISMQTFVDFFYIYSKRVNKYPFYYLRLPLSIFMIIVLFFIQL